MSSAAAVEQSPPRLESAFWRLKLPKETTDYVPRILALSRIIANPAAYGVRLPPLVNQPYLFRVDVASDVKITDAFVLAGIPNQDFFRFNPGFKPGVSIQDSNPASSRRRALITCCCLWSRPKL